MQKKHTYAILLIFSFILWIANSIHINQVAESLRSGISSIYYDIHTTDSNFGTDCLKINYEGASVPFGVFHRTNSSTLYSQLYYSEMRNPEQADKFYGTVKLSERGSQGTIKFNSYGGFFIAYEIENKQKGNTIALRYYENQQKIQINNYLYQYQIVQLVSGKKVRNIGTPSIEIINLISSESQLKFNQYLITIKFHYSLDGIHDYPGYGQIYVRPLRDFVNSQGKWIGGSKEQYSDWNGYADISAQGILKTAGCDGKIGQRDSFYVKGEQYYLYECNINPDFDWYSWRIYILSFKQKKALSLGFDFNGDIDIANPHISLRSQTNNSYDFVLTFFLPSEGAKQTGARAGEVLVISKFNAI